MMQSHAAVPDPQFARQLPYHFARSKGVIAVQLQGDAVKVLVREGVEALTLAEVRRVLKRPLAVEVLSAQQFERSLAQAYARSDRDAANLMVEGVEQELDLQQLAQEIPQVTDLLEAEDDAPVIRLINALLTQALRENASDIHIEPFETRSVVRFRVDGVLRDIIEPQRTLHAALVSRIKVMAQLDIAEKRLPQDGRITLRLAGRPVDVRVSTLPTGHGERAVLRLLDKQAGRLVLSHLGMGDACLAGVGDLVREPHGIFLVTGPTGSGKSTTLYAALSQFDAKSLNIMTVEDPIEYDLDGIGQTQVNPRIDMTFARALRTILRQDPDVIMIGEIRDLETAQIAVQASLTGHLVLATLHTNSAIGAVMRLTDMGVEPYLLASSLLGVLGQRLVRQLCPACRKPHRPDGAERQLLGTEPDDGVIYAPVGCPVCNFSGYRGRSGIFELFQVDDRLRQMIHDGAAEQALRDYLAARGMATLRQDGMSRVQRGETSVEEVLRATRE